MKKIDFTVAGIISAVWAIFICIYCGWGGAINPNNRIDMGNGLYFPLPSRYWDWLFAGLFYIMMATCLRGHWLPNRERNRERTRDEAGDILLFLFTFVITAIIVENVLDVNLHNTENRVDVPLTFILSCIGARRGRPFHILMCFLCIISLIHVIVFGWYFASLATLIILVAKVLIWLAVNTVRSGFSTAWRQLWTSLVLGKNPFDEGDSGNVPAIDTVALKNHADYQREARAQ